jgi:hypothetical protein
MMLTDSSMPPTIGALRARVSEWPRRISASDSTPPSTPPENPQIAGSEATRPACRIVMPRACTR